MQENEIREFIKFKLKSYRDELLELKLTYNDLLQYKNELESNYYNYVDFQIKRDELAKRICNCSLLLLIVGLGGMFLSSKYNSNIDIIDSIINNKYLYLTSDVIGVFGLMMDKTVARGIINKKYASEIKKQDDKNKEIDEELDMLNINLENVNNAIAIKNNDIGRLKNASLILDEIEKEFYQDNNSLTRTLGK